MKTVSLVILSFFYLSSFGQTSSKVAEKFLGISVYVHHTVVNPGDSIVLPERAYIIELYVIEHGDYTVYNDGLPFVYPDNPQVNHIVHRNEGSFEVNGEVLTKAFDPEGNERYADQAIVSKKAKFHLYYFTLAEPKQKLDISPILTVPTEEGELQGR
jgi:hypothetical protein